jgi:pectin methylesterase-like acyl-CoA thioesterase
VQAAINSLPTDNATPTVIKIGPGSYIEKLIVNRPNVTLCGETGHETGTLLTYGDGADTPNGEGGTLGTSGSYSVHISANNVSAENLTFENTRGVGSQAVALLTTGSQLQFRNVRVLGHQDTLYVKSGTQYFRNSYVEGTVDFIFGGATAFFDNCTVVSISGGGTAVTAPNTAQATGYGLVFFGGSLTADASVKDGSTALGRNWGAYGAAAFLKTALGKHIAAVGWVAMGSNTLSTARFSEYQTTGEGANATSRASASRQLSDGEAANYTVSQVLGYEPSFAQ